MTNRPHLPTKLTADKLPTSVVAIVDYQDGGQREKLRRPAYLVGRAFRSDTFAGRPVDEPIEKRHAAVDTLGVVTKTGYTKDLLLAIAALLQASREVNNAARYENSRWFALPSTKRSGPISGRSSTRSSRRRPGSRS